MKATVKFYNGDVLVYECTSPRVMEDSVRAQIDLLARAHNIDKYYNYVVFDGRGYVQEPDLG